MVFFTLHKQHEQLTDIFLITGTGLTSNIYLLGEREITVIDAGNDSEPDVLITELRKTHLNIKDIAQIIITHTHFDHIGGLSELVRYVSPQIYVHETERSILSPIIEAKQLVTVHDGDILATEVGSLQVHHTPGHSPGSICLYDQTKHILYSGDTVFPNGLFGRCDLRCGDAQALVQSLRRISTLDTAILLPGHENPVFHHAKQHVELSFRNAQTYFS
jgi:hydroxyacylglutathione hydrolase